MPDKPGAVASIVTTTMARAVAEKNGVHFEDTFTGFKFMAERISEWEDAGSYQYIFAYEESYGYMVGDFVRDKDAVTAAALTAEMASYYLTKGLTLIDVLNQLYEEYGYYREKTINIVMPGADGLDKMAQMMKALRDEPASEIGGTAVSRIRDYLDGCILVSGLGKVGKTSFWGSNVLYYELSDGCSFIIRPSGTEPKIKIYLLVRGKDEAECAERIMRYSEYAEQFQAQ